MRLVGQRLKIRSDPKGVMSDTVVMRSAVAGDAACITATIAAAFEQYRGRLVPESGAFRETPDGISRELATGSDAIIAEQDGEALGCVMLKTVDRDLYFGRLAVIPWARGRGIARRLVKAVEDEACRRGLAGVRLGVRIVLTENRRFFSSLGYVETSREAHPGFDHPTSITMRKALSPDRRCCSRASRAG
jgi:predicted N-acetyltransferase YhbS